MTKFGDIFNLLLVYSAINVLAYFVSNGMIFLPPPASYKDSDSNTIIKLTTSDNKKITAMYLENENAEYTILYSHGNATDIGYMSSFFKQYYNHNYSFLSYDYHGYGTSEGRPNEKNSYKDIKAAYDFLVNEKQINPKKIILIGNSVGSGPTLELAAKEEIGALVLESAFVTAFRVLTRIPLLVVDKFRNNRKIKKVKVPTLFIHGEEDVTISIWHSEKLYDIVSKDIPKKFIRVKDADHNNIYSVMGEDYWQELEEFLSNNL